MPIDIPVNPKASVPKIKYIILINQINLAVLITLGSNLSSRASPKYIPNAPPAPLIRKDRSMIAIPCPPMNGPRCRHKLWAYDK